MPRSAGTWVFDLDAVKLGIDRQIAAYQQRRNAAAHDVLSEAIYGGALAALQQTRREIDDLEEGGLEITEDDERAGLV